MLNYLKRGSIIIHCNPFKKKIHVELKENHAINHDDPAQFFYYGNIQ